MLGNCLLGVFLHLIINSGMDAEAVAAKIIAAAVGLEILVEPAVKVVVGPAEGVADIILVIGIARLLGLFCAHIAAKHILKIRCQAGVVVLRLERKKDGKLLDGITLFLGNHPAGAHAVDDGIAACEGFIGIGNGIVAGRLVDDAD